MVKQWLQQLLAVLCAGTTLCDLLKQNQHHSYFNYETNPVSVWDFVLEVHFVQERIPSSLTHTAIRVWFHKLRR